MDDGSIPSENDHDIDHDQEASDFDDGTMYNANEEETMAMLGYVIQTVFDVDFSILVFNLMFKLDELNILVLA